MDIYQHRRHNKNLLLVHMIFVTKYRKDILLGKISTDVQQFLYEACTQHHWYAKRIGVDRNHVHILLQYNPTDSITKIAAALKQYSTYKMWTYHGSFLKRHYWKEQTLWSDGYFAASVGQVSQTVVDQYIANQG